MGRFVTIASLSIAALSLGFAGALLLEQLPTTQELESDLKEVRQQLSSAEQDGAKYSGGVIKVLIEARRQILSNTEAMLIQKQSALLRRISLKFVVQGRELMEATDAELKDVVEEINQAERKLPECFKP